MSKPSKQDLKIMEENKRDYKKALKRIWISFACLIPVLLLLSVGMSFLEFPSWLVVIVNVILGGFVCLLVYIISDKVEDKKKLKKLLDMDTYDPFKD